MIDRIDEGWEEVFEAFGTESLKFTLSQVTTALAAVVKHYDYAETEIWAILQLEDGRVAYIEGGCDTTGWDCQSNCSGAVAVTLDELIPQITDEGCVRLEIQRVPLL